MYSALGPVVDALKPTAGPEAQVPAVMFNDSATACRAVSPLSKQVVRHAIRAVIRPPRRRAERTTIAIDFASSHRCCTARW